MTTPQHSVTEHGTTTCPVEHVRANVDDGTCSACGGVVTAPESTSTLLASREALAEAMIRHQRIPMFDGTGSQRCSGCDHLEGEPDGANSPRHLAHQIDMAFASGVVQEPAEFVAGLAEDEAVMCRMALVQHDVVGSISDSLRSTITRLASEDTRALAAALKASR